MSRAAKWVLVPGAATVLWVTFANAASGLTSEQIAAERRQVESTFAQAQAECKQRFQVTQCVDDARAARRGALAPLQQQQNLLDDAKRRERAAQRLQLIQTRAAPASAVALPLQSKAPRTLQASASSAAVPHEAKNPAAALATGAALAHQRQAAAQARQQQAADHAQALQERNARLDARRPPAASLPVPQASAVPR
jgi:hypothetical protein